MINDSLFAPLPKEALQKKEKTRPSLNFWQDGWSRLKQNKMSMIGLYLIILIALFSIIGPFLVPYTYQNIDLARTFLNPSWQHWFGTDELGRDVLVRVMWGGRISLTVGLVASFINLVIGVIYGGISGYFGGKIDEFMMRIVDIIYSIPILLIVILLMVILKPGLTNIFIALGLSYWVGMARIVRGQILTLKEQEFALAAKMLGATNRQVLFKHLLPNTIGPITVSVTLMIPNAIFFEAFLSFIGLGVSAPMASWGVLASDGIRAINAYPFLLFFPAFFICLTMLSFNFLGDGLRDAFDPRLRK
ncbi:ABC transporter permease [bacterium]|nr:ABC transporter permease [bacterium]